MPDLKESYNEFIWYNEFHATIQSDSFYLTIGVIWNEGKPVNYSRFHVYLIINCDLN